MTNEEKRELKQLCREGDSFEDIKGCVNCCDATIRSYLKVFSPHPKNKDKAMKQ